jgi:hypothetical protein
VTTATTQSVCECQARLFAELDEQKQVCRGWATDRRRGKTRNAPGHSIHSSHDRFQIAWSCPFCGRNTLRSFDTGGLSYAEAEVAAAATP